MLAGDEGVERRPELRADVVALDQNLVLSVGDHDQTADFEPRREPLERRRGNDAIGAGGDHQRRRERPSRIFGIGGKKDIEGCTVADLRVEIPGRAVRDLKIEIGTLICSRVFYNNVSVLDSCATRFRFD